MKPRTVDEMYPDCVRQLIEELKKLPGIGSRTAERLALFISQQDRRDTLNLAESIREVAEKILCCSHCFNTSESDPCPICRASGRERDKILVVEGPGDLNAFEEAGWNGLYHVLQGVLDPIEGVLPEHLTLKALLVRVRRESPTEIIIATNPDFEGDGTALMLTQALKDCDVKVTRIARGIATGAKIEYANRAMLTDSLEGRTPLARGN
ncbi:MAG: recombination mediator RecR [Planctomycetes bacterium]|nr:recombination mediator RecR [Planctomycetota bacterium]